MEKNTNLVKQENDNSVLLPQDSDNRLKKWRFINLEYMEMISPGNTTFFVQMMKIFRKESVVSMNKMRDEFLSQDFCALARTAHAMKPTGTYIGVDSIRVLMDKLEKVASAGIDTEIQSLMVELQVMVTSVNQEIDEYLEAA